VGLILTAIVLSGWTQERVWERASNTSAGANLVPEKERIDINRATAEELLRAPGMTPSWAGRIVRYRPYHAKTDLLERGVVPSAVYERIKNYVIAHRVEKLEEKH
jgi:DNA uptake protein ComE-like DNA-binding protein